MKSGSYEKKRSVHSNILPLSIIKKTSPITYQVDADRLWGWAMEMLTYGDTDDNWLWLLMQLLTEQR